MWDLTTREGLERYLLECDINITSPYSDGYSIDWWKQEKAATEKKLKAIGKQLKFEF